MIPDTRIPYVLICLLACVLLLPSAEASGNASLGTTASGSPDQIEPRNIRLPEPWKQFSVGGFGQYLTFHLPRARRLVTIDVSARAVVHQVQDVPDDVVFSAGAEALFIARPGQRTLEKRSLANGERIKIAPLPGNGVVNAVRIGSNAVGPLVVVSTGQADLVDTDSLKSSGLTIGGQERGGYDYSLDVSADGQTMAVIPKGYGPVPWALVRPLQPDVEPRRFGSTSNAVRWTVPSADGSVVFVPGGAFDSNLEPLAMAEFKGFRLFPTVDPRFFLAIRFDNDLTVCRICNTSDRRVYHTLHDFSEMAPRGNTRNQYEITRRLNATRQAPFHFVPELKTFVTLNWDNQIVSIREFDLFAALAADSEDFLFVTSNPPLSAVRGESVSHQFECLAAKPGVTYELASGPEAMTVSAAGRLSWKVPEFTADESAPVLVKVTAGSAETFYSFELQLLDPKR